MERPNEQTCDSGGGDPNDPRDLVEEKPQKNHLATVDEAGAPEDVASDNVISEDKHSKGRAQEGREPAGMVTEDMTPEDNSCRNRTSEDVAWKDVSLKPEARAKVKDYDVSPQGEPLLKVAEGNEAADEVMVGALVSGAENTASPNSQDLEIECKEKDLAIAKLQKDLSERDQRESEVLLELTALMNNYRSLDQTLGAVMEMNIKYVQQIEEQIQEMSELRATVGTLENMETERKSEFQSDAGKASGCNGMQRLLMRVHEASDAELWAYLL